MLRGHCLHILNNFFLESVFCMGDQIKQELVLQSRGSCRALLLPPPYFLRMGSWLTAVLCLWHAGLFSAPAQCQLPPSTEEGAWVQVSGPVRVDLSELMCLVASLGRA